jgi:hypothetical protein
VAHDPELGGHTRYRSVWHHSNALRASKIRITITITITITKVGPLAHPVRSQVTPPTVRTMCMHNISQSQYNTSKNTAVIQHH